jgi:predicted dehydrogenase
MKRLRVAIVGCGKVADAHAEQIRRLADIVAVCDSEELMARQLAERFDVARCYSDLNDLLGESGPDVVHVTTPPQSHFSIARRCLEHGSHVYVEKPFTVDAGEAEDLLLLAERLHLRLTVGHDAQFSQAARGMRNLIQTGYLGDHVVHMESYYGYDLADPAYAAAFLAENEHWVRKLPGGLLQNVMSHGIARVAELLVGDQPRVIARAFASPLLKRLGGGEVLDELRTMIVDDRGTTAYFTFSSQMRPLVQHFRVFGSRNGLVLDEQQQTVLKLRGRAFKSYVERFVPHVLFAGQYLEASARNVRLFLGNDFHMEAGKKELIGQFYRSILEDGPPPIPSNEILRTARIMDAIVEQVGTSLPQAEVIPC